MRKLCPNIDKDDGLETVLEVPIPEEMFKRVGNNANVRFQNMLTWMKAQTSDKWSAPIIASRLNELRFLLYLVGSPVIPLQLHLGHCFNQQRPAKDCSIQASTAKYIMQQYVAAMGGQAALKAVESMCVIGAVRMSATEFHLSSAAEEEEGDEANKVTEEQGGFVVWQKNPDLWSLELLVSGCKVICGSNSNVSWRHSSNHPSPPSTGPPRPLRRFLQGLDPRATASLFSDAMCIGEKMVEGEDCFILKVEAGAAVLEAQSGQGHEIIHHTMWGYFSQRSGLLTQFEDSRLLRMPGTGGDGDDGVFWETSAESVIGDYKFVDGVNVAHGGRTKVVVFRYGEQSANHKREMAETWKIDEVHFNVWGLGNDFFLPPLLDHRRSRSNAR